jgi:hypothetical protein
MIAVAMLFFPFEIQIPNNANKSYVLTYSEYRWGLEAKFFNLPWSSNIYLCQGIVKVVS